MKLKVDKNNLNMLPSQFLRKAGYGFIRDRHTGHDSYVRRLGSGFYPRLHMYFSEDASSVEFNLHLDQKKASYAGAHMHNAEYDGEVVEEEINRLKDLIIEPQEVAREVSKTNSYSEEANSGNGDYKRDAQRNRKLSWWKRLFKN